MITVTACVTDSVDRAGFGSADAASPGRPVADFFQLPLQNIDQIIVMSAPRGPARFKPMKSTGSTDELDSDVIV